MYTNSLNKTHSAVFIPFKHRIKEECCTNSSTRLDILKTIFKTTYRYSKILIFQKT